MRRREVITFLAGVVTWAAAAKAWAQSKKTPVIGFLGASSAGTAASVLVPAFRRGLEELGFVEGQNVVVDYVWADSLYDRLPPLAAELVRRRRGPGGALPTVTFRFPATCLVGRLLGSPSGVDSLRDLFSLCSMSG